MQDVQTESDLNFFEMQRIIIIDGHNLLNKIPEIKNLYRQDSGKAITKLFNAIKSSLKHKEKLILVLDGFGNQQNQYILYSGKISADEVIRKFIEENYQKSIIKVVSSDREISNLAKACGCDTILSEEFAKSLNNNSKVNINQNKRIVEKEKPESISKKEFEEFKKYFF